MASSLSPFLRLPITDVTSGLISHQIFGRCSVQEMQLMDCLEAYGLDRGLIKCRCYIDDFKECQMMTKQFARFMAMRKERDRQIHCGILTGEKKYVTPRIDSY
ncbi:NADH dehydrogenase [ubiquinone] iron-sulfur protein 5-like isoform X2 [Hyposmocoma kahamanoa]|uniref:NADH dehydrogenase [ubiquinone] iron-sulfur protein 5-like isoform X2 n=1 Tax=Hyposmocoma kahamanoa TaxID=1477025 RepID=UPI000E6D7195|nr:NADH dehydrogenase [ubiquinone] iron-sulfur protein 5-like isoform X2 [Hyposmocoma kahamanoa]